MPGFHTALEASRWLKARTPVLTHIVNKVLVFSMGRNSHPHTCIYWVTSSLFTLSPPPLNPHHWHLAVLLWKKNTEEVNKSVFSSEDGRYMRAKPLFIIVSRTVFSGQTPKTLEMNHWLFLSLPFHHGWVRRATALSVPLIAPLQVKQSARWLNTMDSVTTCR